MGIKNDGGEGYSLVQPGSGRAPSSKVDQANVSGH
jgi:hypothetical protein